MANNAVRFPCHDVSMEITNDSLHTEININGGIGMLECAVKIIMTGGRAASGVDKNFINTFYQACNSDWTANK